MEVPPLCWDIPIPERQRTIDALRVLLANLGIDPLELIEENDDGKPYHGNR